MRYPQLARRWQVLTAGAVVTALVMVAAGGCERVASVVAPVSPPVRAATLKTTQTFFFTKVPATIVNHSIASAPDVDLFDFDLTTTKAKDAALTQVEFMVSGSLQLGDVTNYRLVFFPKGRSNPGVVLATNDGSTWVAPGGFSFITMRLTSPLALGNNFKGSFAFVADVVGTGTFFVWSRLQTASASFNGVEKFLLEETCDLPMQGDNFYVN